MLAISGINFGQKANFGPSLNNQQSSAIKMHSQPLQDCVNFRGLPEKFEEVVAGKNGILYRSNLPIDFQAIKDQGIKYIFDLGGGNDAEKSIVEGLGMVYAKKDLPLSAVEYIPQATPLADEIAEKMKDGPVLVHCRKGISRTGRFIAFFQRYMLKQTPEEVSAYAMKRQGDDVYFLQAVKGILKFAKPKEA